MLLKLNIYFLGYFQNDSIPVCTILVENMNKLSFQAIKTKKKIKPWRGGSKHQLNQIKFHILLLHEKTHLQKKASGN